MSWQQPLALLSGAAALLPRPHPACPLPDLIRGLQGDPRPRSSRKRLCFFRATPAPYLTPSSREPSGGLREGPRERAGCGCGLRPGGPWLPGHPQAGVQAPGDRDRDRAEVGQRRQMETMTSESWNAAWETSMLIHHRQAPPRRAHTSRPLTHEHEHRHTCVHIRARIHKHKLVYSHTCACANTLRAHTSVHGTHTGTHTGTHPCQASDSPALTTAPSLQACGQTQAEGGGEGAVAWQWLGAPGWNTAEGSGCSQPGLVVWTWDISIP